jgi:hypothetical protein
MPFVCGLSLSVNRPRGRGGGISRRSKPKTAFFGEAIESEV